MNYYDNDTTYDNRQKIPRKLLDSICRMDSLNRKINGVAFRIELTKDTRTEEVYYLDIRCDSFGKASCSVIAMENYFFPDTIRGVYKIREISKLHIEICNGKQAKDILCDIYKKKLFDIKDFTSMKDYTEGRRRTGLSLQIETVNQERYKVIALPGFEKNFKKYPELQSLANFLKELIVRYKIDELGFVLVNLG